MADRDADLIQRRLNCISSRCAEQAFGNRDAGQSVGLASTRDSHQYAVSFRRRSRVEHYQGVVDRAARVVDLVLQEEPSVWVEESARPRLYTCYILVGIYDL